MRKFAVLVALGAAFPLASGVLAAQEKPAANALQYKMPAPAVKNPAAAPATKLTEGASGRTIEEIIARVNNEIITRSEYEKARASAEDDAKQECAAKCTPEQLQADIEDRQKNVLRDLIDQSLLVQRGKDMGVSVEPEVITEGKKESELPDLKKKAETALQRVKDGEDFGEIAKRLSDGSTAKQGGFLGVYKRGELSKQLEDIVFKMKKSGLTDVLDTKQGYLVLQVMEHYDEGQQPLSKVENEITDKLYSGRMEPALRDYLRMLREQSYVVIKPGFLDMAGGGNSEILEVSATPEVSKSKKAHKKFLLF